MNGSLWQGFEGFAGRNLGESRQGICCERKWCYSFVMVDNGEWTVSFYGMEGVLFNMWNGSC